MSSSGSRSWRPSPRRSRTADRRRHLRPLTWWRWTWPGRPDASASDDRSDVRLPDDTPEVRILDDPSDVRPLDDRSGGQAAADAVGSLPVARPGTWYETSVDGFTDGPRGARTARHAQVVVPARPGTAIAPHLDAVTVADSRDLGTDDDGVPLTSWDNGSRRPELGKVWLVVQFEVECRQTGADVGGCGVSPG